MVLHLLSLCQLVLPFIPLFYILSPPIMLSKGGVKMAKKSSIPGLSFSLKRATGVTSAKQKIAKATGIPTTKSGRRNKLGRLLGIK